jgi:hypothetical protein
MEDIGIMAFSRDFTLVHNAKYQATIELSWMETFASNEYIAGMFAAGGFRDVQVSGSGEQRIATGTWKGETRSVPMDSHIVNVIRLDTPAVPVVEK